ncbi:MAG: hypothetical protein KGH84_01775, partial [Paracoccaceae bacterium]|nr:hypothetical protein [Paracoccaceae bacterium]
MFSRRAFLSGAAALGVIPVLPALAQSPARPLHMPPLMDATGTGKFALRAQAGRMNFLDRGETASW